MSDIPSPGQIYRHFKGNLYRVVTLAEHSETGELLVIYQALYGEYKVYARPLSMFTEKLDKEKYPKSVSQFRFELQKEVIAAPEPYKAPDEPAPETEKEADYEEQEAAEKEEVNIDPLVLEFLDAGTYEERLNILSALHHRITDEMINIMAIAIDVEIEEGDTEGRFEELRACLKTYEKFESSRLR